MRIPFRFIGLGLTFLLGAAALSFSIQPIPSAKSAGTYRVAILSDLNGSYGSTTYGPSVTNAVKRVISWRPDVVLATGDLVAGQKSSLTNTQIRAMWKSFHKHVSDPLFKAGLQFAPSPGNHDASAGSAFARERGIFVEEWKARKPSIDFVDGSNYPLYYAFKVGPALFISLDSTMVGPLPKKQKDWVLKTLDANASIRTKILYGHVPLVPFTKGRESDYLKDPAFEKALKQRDVTLWVSGHHHGYYPGKRGSLRVVSMACQGDGPRPLIGQTKRSDRNVLLIELDDAGIVSLDAYGGAQYDQLIHRHTLPKSIGSGALRIDRDDL